MGCVSAIGTLPASVSEGDICTICLHAALSLAQDSLPRHGP